MSSKSMRYEMRKVNRSFKLWAVTFLCVFAVASCKKAEPVQTVKQPLVSQELASYASELVAQHPGDLSAAGFPIKTIDIPLSYLIYVTASNPTLMTREGAVNNKDVYDFNLHVTKRWEQMWCTPSLKNTMQKHGVSIVVGQLMDSEAKKHSAAICARDAKPTPPPPTGSSMVDEGGFTTTQICKGAISVLYRRDPNIMSASLGSDHVQIKYTRSSDGKAFSYRCRLKNGQVLLWDDFLEGARWYGSEPTDTKLVYFVKDGRLRVQDVIRDQINREQLFSTDELM